MCLLFLSHSPLHQLLHLSNGHGIHCQWDHCSDEESRGENPFTIMPLPETEHTRVMMPKLRRLIKKACWIGLEESPHKSSQESHTIAYFVAFILKTHGPIFPPVSQDLIRGITISGHLVMLQSEKITYPRL